MLVYPQLATGALSQYPLGKERRRRTVRNATADGRAIKLADPAGEVTEWRLEYAGLSDSEMAALGAFFAAAEGSLNGFTFVDPASNLFAFSDHLDNAVWSREPWLTATGGAADPAGGTSVWRLTNGGAAAQRISQTLAVPGAYLYCLSVYVRSAAAGTVGLMRGSERLTYTLDGTWRRISFAGSGDPAAESITFALEVPAQAAIEVYGMQAEPQGSASAYQPSTMGGVYEGARFRDDELVFTSMGVNSHSVVVNLIHANHL